jgi:hypothetical protein
MTMPLIDIISEQETAQGWTFSVALIDDDGGLHRTELRLSFPDYNLWCPAGSLSPGAVAESVMESMLKRTALESLPKSFDASMLRLKDPSTDREISERLKR